MSISELLNEIPLSPIGMVHPQSVISRSLAAQYNTITPFWDIELYVAGEVLKQI